MSRGELHGDEHGGVIGQLLLAGAVIVGATTDRPGGVADKGVIKPLVAETGAEPAMVASLGLGLEGSVGVEQPEVEQAGVEGVVVGFETGERATGICGRAFGTPCIHEHSCLRCSMHWPDPAQRPRIAEIRDNLLARIAEAEREGWLGEVEGLKISLAGARDKLAQIDRRPDPGGPVDIGMPALPPARDGNPS